jgi:hypothetical protein
VRYLPPFEALKPYLTISTAKGKLEVSCSYENLVQLVRRIIIDVPVDEPWYLERYPDVAEAISQGIVASSKSHFVNDGYFEGSGGRLRRDSVSVPLSGSSAGWVHSVPFRGFTQGGL